MKKILALSILIMVALCACSSDNGQPVQTSRGTAQPTEAVSAVPIKEANQEQILLDDSNVRVSFIEVFEEKGIDGAFYFRIKVENKTDKTVVIYLVDPSVNNVSTLALSGLPMTIQPGAKSLTPFFFSYSNLDISSIDELREISFKVKVEDNDGFSEIETSDFLTVSF